MSDGMKFVRVSLDLSLVGTASTSLLAGALARDMKSYEDQLARSADFENFAYKLASDLELNTGDGMRALVLSTLNAWKFAFGNIGASEEKCNECLLYMLTQMKRVLERRPEDLSVLREIHKTPAQENLIVTDSNGKPIRM